jgi:uncharacterized membrane protein HdeD (DUF308 family)
MRLIPTIDDLSAVWKLLVVRAGIILVLSVIALLWPAASVAGLLIILTTVALVAALFDAAIAGALQGRLVGGWALLPEALVGVLLGGAVLLYPLAPLGVVVVLLSLWMFARGIVLLAVARGASSDRVILTLATGWMVVSVFAPLAVILRSSEMPILEIIDLLLAYVLTWSALELTIGLHLRSCARRLTRTEA